MLTKPDPLPTWRAFDQVSWHPTSDAIVAAHAGAEVFGLPGRVFHWSLDPTHDSQNAYEAEEYGLSELTAYNPIDASWFQGGSQTYLINTLGKRQMEFDKKQLHATRFSFSPDGRLLVLTNPSGAVQLRELGKFVRQYSGLNARVSGILWNLTARHFSGWDHNGNVCIWSTDTTSPVYQSSGITWAGAAHRPKSPAWSPDGTKLAWLAPTELVFATVASEGITEERIAWENRPVSGLHWRPDGNAIIVDNHIYDLTGKEVHQLQGADSLSDLQWLNDGKGTVAVSGSSAVIWSDIKEPPTRIRIPGVERTPVRPADKGANRQALSSDGRYWTTVSVQMKEYGRGNPLLIDLQEKKLVWVGVGFSDGAMFRLSAGGQIISGPKDVDRYFTYLVRLPEGYTVPLKQLQFASRIGLSPVEQCMQRILDLGGQIYLNDEVDPFTSSDIRDARYLPKPEDITRISLANSHHVSHDTLQHIAKLTNLHTINLSGSRVRDVDLGGLLDVTSLKTLDISSTAVSNQLGAALPANLQYLDVSNTKVADLFSSGIKSFQNLKVLNATNTAISPTAMESLRTSRPHLEIQHRVIHRFVNGSYPIPD